VRQPRTPWYAKVVAAVLRLVPADVLADCRERAQVPWSAGWSQVGAAFIVAVWLVVARSYHGRCRPM
jgi:hypothetical protein